MRSPQCQAPTHCPDPVCPVPPSFLELPPHSPERSLLWAQTSHPKHTQSGNARRRGSSDKGKQSVFPRTRGSPCCLRQGGGRADEAQLHGREGAALRAGRTGQQGDCIRAAGSVRHPGWEVQTAKLMGEQCSPRPEFSERSATPAVNFAQREHKLEGEKLPEVPTENPSCRVGFLEQQPHL